MSMLESHVKTDTGKITKTKQQFKDQCDINKIMKRYQKSGTIDHFSSQEPFYGDVSGLTGYKDHLEKVMEANHLFNGMEADIRERFENSPEKFIDFMGDEKNIDEALELGIITKKPEEEKPPERKVRETDKSQEKIKDKKDDKNKEN